MKTEESQCDSVNVVENSSLCTPSPDTTLPTSDTVISSEVPAINVASDDVTVTTPDTDDVKRSRSPSPMVQQLVDWSAALSRFITMECITDGGALSQAFRSR